MKMLLARLAVFQRFFGVCFFFWPSQLFLPPEIQH